MVLFCLTKGSKYNQDCLSDTLNSHPSKEVMLTDIHPLITAVLHRVEISRGRARSLERRAHGELCCPVTIFGAANLTLQTV